LSCWEFNSCKGNISDMAVPLKHLAQRWHQLPAALFLRLC
jgi:hypothetical protein